eukprot:TRINITY_DN5981_c0_g1_i2.p1 TRINITY_DN5981_c0_g1~~TRINITY_DN5981_c0_g1_i2.p1  ORF type:complete len:476 (-),score=42.67 TRINITY_DN5981_c0_g1_i2:141-1568(-)
MAAPRALARLTLARTPAHLLLRQWEARTAEVCTVAASMAGAMGAMVLGTTGHTRTAAVRPPMIALPRRLPMVVVSMAAPSRPLHTFPGLPLLLISTQAITMMISALRVARTTVVPISHRTASSLYRHRHGLHRQAYIIVPPAPAPAPYEPEPVYIPAPAPAPAPYVPPPAPAPVYVPPVAPAPAPMAASLQPTKPAGEVPVTVHKGEGMPGVLLERTDPSVEATVAGESKRTSAKEDAGKNAVWEESLTFSNVKASDLISFKLIFDDNSITKDTLLAQGSLPAEECRNKLVQLSPNGKLFVSVASGIAPVAAKAVAPASKSVGPKPPSATQMPSLKPIAPKASATPAPAPAPARPPAPAPAPAPAPVAPKATSRKVTVVRGDALPASPIEPFDPYVVLTLGTTVHKTSVKPDAGKKAIWNESFEFPITPGHSTLQVQLFDQQVNECVGEFTVPLAPAPQTAHNLTPRGRIELLIE